MHTAPLRLSSTTGTIFATLHFLAGMSGSLLIVRMAPFTGGGTQALFFVLIYGLPVCLFIWLFGRHLRWLTAAEPIAAMALAHGQLLGGSLLAGLFGLVVLFSFRATNTVADPNSIGLVTGMIMVVQGQRLRHYLKRHANAKGQKRR